MPYGDVTEYRGTDQRELGIVKLANEPDHKEWIRFAHCDNGRVPPYLDMRMFVDSERGRNGGYTGPTKNAFTFHGKEMVRLFATMRLLEEDFEMDADAIQLEMSRQREEYRKANTAGVSSG
jgi:hypothetical protein